MTAQEIKDLITLILVCAGIGIFAICIVGLVVGGFMVRRWAELNPDEEYLDLKINDDISNEICEGK